MRSPGDNPVSACTSPPTAARDPAHSRGPLPRRSGFGRPGSSAIPVAAAPDPAAPTLFLAGLTATRFGLGSWKLAGSAWKRIRHNRNHDHPSCTVFSGLCKRLTPATAPGAFVTRLNLPPALIALRLARRCLAALTLRFIMIQRVRRNSR